MIATLRPWRAVVTFAPSTAEQRLAGLFAHRESARAVGRAYLSAGARAASVPALVASIAAELPRGRATLRQASDDELRGLLSARIRADFETDRTVDVHGWLLSSTEARLYALAALV
jgi:hypothetical protein